MRYVSQNELERAALYRMFDYTQVDGRAITMDVITGLLKGKFSGRRVQLALDSLSEEAFLDVRRAMNKPATYAISSKGYRSIEAALERHDAFLVAFGEGGEDWLMSDASDEGAVPASDRLVHINHNSPGYDESLAAFDAVIDGIRGDNGVDLSDQEKSRALASLQAAKELWQSVQLKRIQLRVGIKMAIEDAAIVFKDKAVDLAVAALIALVRSFMKTSMHVDWDQL